MRKAILISLVIFSIVLLFAPHKSQLIPERKGKGMPSFGSVNEEITYDVLLRNVHLGKAIFKQLGKVKLKEEVLNVSTFTTKLTGFSDLEKIYSDKNSLPIRIEREINAWAAKEKIVEEYDQEKFTLSITKLKRGRQEDMLITKDSAIHNAILLPYYVRNIAKLDVGWTLKAQLPNQGYEIKLVSVEDVDVPAGTFKAYHFESEPNKFEIWVTADERRIPVKIKGSGVLGYTLVMKDYSL